MLPLPPPASAHVPHPGGGGRKTEEEVGMTDAEFLDKLWAYVCEHCVERCEEAESMLDEHDGRVPRGVRRAVKELVRAVNEVGWVISRASRRATKAARPSATVHQLRPEL
jgi:hypothetical protein